MPRKISYFEVYEKIPERDLVVFEEGVLIAWRNLQNELKLTDQEVESFLQEHIGTVMFG